MLTIRQEQLDQLANHRRREFTTKLYSFLRSWKPGLELAEVEHGIAEAARYGFTRECDVAGFVEIVCLDMDGFSEPLPKPALAFVTAYGADPKARLERLACWVAGRE